jgi:hypothetical protein
MSDGMMGEGWRSEGRERKEKSGEFTGDGRRKEGLV